MKQILPSRLVLASGSARRRQLLAEAGLEFEVVVPAIPEPENGPAKLSPARQAEALAYFKARAVAEEHPDATVLGADTVVAGDHGVLGKPADAGEAQRMLGLLSGTRHQVITGVAVLGPQGERLIASDSTYVTMRRMGEEEIESYVVSGEWQGKAGAYAIQETADRFVEALEGSFTNVVGLPIELVLRMLQELRDHPNWHKAV